MVPRDPLPEWIHVGAVMDIKFTDGRHFEAMEIVAIAAGKVTWKYAKGRKGRWWLSIETVLECGRIHE